MEEGERLGTVGAKHEGESAMQQDAFIDQGFVDVIRREMLRSNAEQRCTSQESTRPVLALPFKD